MELQLFLHDHPMKTTKKERKDKLLCNGCNKPLVGDTYYCDPCQFYLHKSCAELPQKLQHFFHACPLTLELCTTFICDVCDKHRSDLTYHCRQCDFYMDVDCAKFPTASSQEEHVQHFCHYHPLKLFEEITVNKPVCQICGAVCSDFVYGCSINCSFYIHKNCMDILPRSIDYKYHSCTLVLHTFGPLECVACDKEDVGLTFRCVRCWFDLCVYCALRSMNDLEDHGIFKSNYHRHMLTLNEKNNVVEAACAMCGDDSVGAMGYGCKRCDRFFHESCAELPREIQHMIHPQHLLSLKETSFSKSSRAHCSWCRMRFRYNDFQCYHAYYCNKCNYQLHIQCASSFSCIKYDGHEHFLTIVKNSHGDTKCYSCSKSCESSIAFRCTECIDFSLHFLCGPLPCTIKDKCHVHPLTLEDFSVEDYGTKMFACHVCENERNPRFCVYRCTEGCEMICEIDCVASEVLSSLQGERGDEKLRTVSSNIKGNTVSKDSVWEKIKQRSRHKGATGQKVKKKPFYFFVDMIDSLCEFEKTESDDIAWDLDQEEEIGEDDDKEQWTDELDENEDYLYADDSDDEARRQWNKDVNDHVVENCDKAMSTFSRKALTKYMDGLDSAPGSFVSDIVHLVSRHNRFLVSGEYLLPQTLIPYFPKFEKLFNQYQVIPAKSKLSLKTMSQFVFILCAVIHSMFVTKVVDVTKGKVRQWLACLKLVKRGGLEVGFVVEHIRRVAQAKFVIKARDLIHCSFCQLRDKADHFTEEIDQLNRRLETAKGILEATKKKQEHLNAYWATALKSLRKEWQDASQFKWKPAVIGL